MLFVNNLTTLFSYKVIVTKNYESKLLFFFALFLNFYFNFNYLRKNVLKVL